jgi:hypothetical protein
MADFILGDGQNVDLGIVPGPDAAGNPTAGAFDAGSVTATLPESTNLIATVSADQTSINVKAEGPLTTDDVLTITGTVNGASVTVDFPFDVDAEAPTDITVTPGTPVAN